MIEVLIQVRKGKGKDNQILHKGLDLVEKDEHITHQMQLDEELDVQKILMRHLDSVRKTMILKRRRVSNIVFFILSTHLLFPSRGIESY